jgi:hypothetical protein
VEAEAIREAIRAQPFRPFRLHLADGRSILVAHPELILVTPQGRRVVVARAEDDGLTLVEPLLIVTLETIEPASAPGANGPAS